MIEREMLDEIEEFLDEAKDEIDNIVDERFGGDWNAAVDSGELKDLCDEHSDLADYVNERCANSAPNLIKKMVTLEFSNDWKAAFEKLSERTIRSQEIYDRYFSMEGEMEFEEVVDYLESNCEEDE